MLLRLADRSVTPFLNTTFREIYPEFSPNGRWIAYVSDESGRPEVYVQSFPARGGTWQISTEGGREPLWSASRKQIFYRWQNQVWVVDVQAGSGFDASKPRLLCDQPGYAPSSPIRSWDIAADGRRFLMVQIRQSKPQLISDLVRGHPAPRASRKKVVTPRLVVAPHPRL